MELGLHTIPTEDLVKELQSRGEASVILLLRNAANFTETHGCHNNCEQWYSGDIHAAIGMCQTALDWIRDTVRKTRE